MFNGVHKEDIIRFISVSEINNRLILQWGNYTGSQNLIITFLIAYNTNRYTCVSNFRDSQDGDTISIRHMSMYNATKTQIQTRTGNTHCKGVISIGY